MSPSAYLRGRGHSILYTLSYLAHLEQLGVRVVNGLSAFRVETSKALQLSLLKSLGLPFPPARGHQPSRRRRRRPPKGLRFPVVVKANIGGSGAGIVRFDRPEDLERAVAEGRRRSRPRSDRAGAGVHPGARRPHHARRGARRQVPLRDQRLQHRRDASTSARPTSARRATASSWRARACPVDAPKNSLRVEGHDAARRGHRRRRAHHARGRHRRRRRRVHRRRPRRPALLLRHQRALELRRRRAARDRLRSVRPARGLPRAGGARDALRLLAAGLRRLAAQRRRRADGADVGLRQDARAAQRGVGLRPDARSPS